LQILSLQEELKEPMGTMNEVVTVSDAAYLKEVCTLLGENVKDTIAPAEAKAWVLCVVS
jgi:hypothetical protein